MTDRDAEQVELEEEYGVLRPMLFSIAYRMLGSVVDAEDVVSDAYFRLRRTIDEHREIRDPKHYLATVVTRLSIDHLRSARVRREAYVGPWLPEPLVGTADVVDFERVELSDTLSMAFLVLLERLSPTERAVFLLREVFEFDYPALARIVDKTEPNCRQILRRAKRQIEHGRPRFEAVRAERDALADRFFAAIVEGELSPLVELLTEDVVMHGDGGGQGPSFRRLVVGREKVLRLMSFWSDTITKVGLHLERAEVNGQPGALFRDHEGRLLNVMALDVADGGIQTVRSVINPAKLQHLGPLLDGRGVTRRLHRARRTG